MASPPSFDQFTPAAAQEQQPLDPFASFVQLPEVPASVTPAPLLPFDGLLAPLLRPQRRAVSELSLTDQHDTRVRAFAAAQAARGHTYVAGTRT